MHRIAAVGAVLMFTAVAAGAFGAHALKDRLDEYSRGVYDKAVFYHFIHAIALLLIASLVSSRVIEEGAAVRVSLLLTGGIIIFSGTLYLLAISGVRWLGAITPIGGTLFLVAWAYLAYSAWISR